MTASTQLRAIEGEIEETLSGRGTLTTLAVARKAITIAKELEAELEQIHSKDRIKTNEINILTEENRTLKRRLDEAIEERDTLIAFRKSESEFENLVEKEFTGRIDAVEAARLVELQALANAASDIVAPYPVEAAERLFTRITEIDKL